MERNKNIFIKVMNVEEKDLYILELYGKLEVCCFVGNYK